MLSVFMPQKDRDWLQKRSRTDHYLYPSVGENEQRCPPRAELVKCGVLGKIFCEPLKLESLTSARHHIRYATARA